MPLVPNKAGAPPIRSRENPRFRFLRSLHHAKGITRAGMALVPGEKLVSELLARDPARCEAQVVAEGSAPAVPGLASIVLSRALFREVDVWGTGPPLLLVRVPTLTPLESGPWPPGCTVVLPLQDPKNVGAALRSAAAFGVTGAVLTAEAAHPCLPEAVRPGAGAQWTVRLWRAGPLGDASWLPRPLLALDRRGISLEEVRWPAAFGLLVGMEGRGLPAGLAEVLPVAVPMRGSVESLNASVALGIALYRWSTAAKA